jgi:hypothetical protein
MNAALLLLAVMPAADPVGFPKFETQEIAKDLKIGYAVITADVNGDKKPDIVVVDKERVVWYENPTWKVHTIITGKTKPDNVCIAAADIDGDGQIDFVLGAGWRPADTNTPGTLQWLKRGKTLDEEWSVYPIPCDEPTVHRVQVAELGDYGSGSPHIIMAPLQGRGATAKGNWTDGKPVRILAYPIPKEPLKAENWKPRVLNEELYVVHNFAMTPRKLGQVLTAASYDGVHQIFLDANNQSVKAKKIGEGNQSNPKSNRGSSEIGIGKDKRQFIFTATVEPWHGNQIVTYVERWNDLEYSYSRHVIDDHLRWGHAIKFADLDGNGIDELIAGIRDNPNTKAGDKFTEKCGVRVYRNTDGKGEKWDRMLLDEGGVAVEDLTVADLNGDGKPDIVAVGRATGNCRIYWNNGK